MGFLNVLGRLIKGQPAFVAPEPTAQQASASAQPQPAAQQSAAPTGPKVYPQVVIERVQCHMSGDDMDLEVSIQNNSQGQVELDTFELFGRRQDLGTFLRPGEEREFSVYKGSRPTSTNQNSCRVFYKDQAGDYFASQHYVEFRQQADGTYIVDRMRFTRVDDV